MRFSESDKDSLDAAIKQRDKIENNPDKKPASNDAKKTESGRKNNTEKKADENINDSPAPEKTSAAPKSPKDTAEKSSGSESGEEQEERRPKEDLLENATRNPFKRMKYEHARVAAEMKEMNFVEKLKYIFYYYKWHMLVGLIIVFFLLTVINTIYQNSRPVAISYVIVNSFSLDDTIDRTIFTDFADYRNMDSGYKIDSIDDITLDFDKYKENPDYLMVNNYRYMSFSESCTDNYFDIMFTDRSGLDVCCARAHVYPVDQILTEENYEKCKADGRLTAAAGYGGNIGYYAIDISDIPAVKAMHLRYSDIYLSFPGKSEQNIENANKFVEFLLK